MGVRTYRNSTVIRITMPPYYLWVDEVCDWVKENCKGEFELFGLRGENQDDTTQFDALFELDTDAVLFALKWK